MADDAKPTENPAPAAAPTPPAPTPPAHQRAQPNPPGSVALWFNGPTLNWTDGANVELRVDARQDWRPADQPRVLNGTISARVQGGGPVTQKLVQISIAEISEV